ncbi:FkbM family methyltransferase [Alsobacter sp. R-9]
MTALARLPRQLRAIAAHPLNDGKEGAALARWLRWQICSRLAPGPIAVPFVAGTCLLGRAGEAGITGNVFYGLAEYAEMAFALRLLRIDDLFVDIGANAGSYSILAAGACAASVVAFEPDANASARFVQNIRLNGLQDHIVLKRVAVGDRAGPIEFTTDADTGNRVSTGRNAAGPRTTTVECVTLDETLRGRAPTLIKIDVEGFEAAVLAGAKDVLGTPSLLALIVETNGSESAYGRTENGVTGPLKAAGFQPMQYDPYTNLLTPMDPSRRTDNTIFVRPGDAVAARLRSSAFRNDLRLREPPMPVR